MGKIIKLPNISVAKNNGLPHHQTLDLSKFNINVLNHRPEKRFRENYNSAYKLWKTVWERSFKAANIDEQIGGDQFLAMDDIIIVNYENRPIGLMGIRYLDLYIESVLESSYAKKYSNEAIAVLKRNNHECVAALVGLTVCPSFKRLSIRLSIKDLLGSLCMKRSKEQNMDAVIAFTRNDKGVNSLFARFGAESIYKDLKIYHGSADIMLLEWEKYHETQAEGVGALSSSLWNSQNRALKAA